MMTDTVDGSVRLQAASDGGLHRRPGRMDARDALLELGRLPLGALELGVVLTRIADLAQASIAGADDVSVTLLERGKPRSAAFTGTLAPYLDERQYERGFGPCLDAAVAGQRVVVNDTTTDDTYPAFSAVCRRVAVTSVAAIGMPSPQETSGVLNLYSRTAGMWTDDALDTAQAFADYAAVVLLNAASLHSTMSLARQLEVALTSRAVIEQAKGILIARRALTPDGAFAELSRQSQNANRKLHDLAKALVDEASTQPAASPASVSG